MKTCAGIQETNEKIFNNKTLICILISTFTWGMIAHGYCYFNLLYSHDSLLMIYQNDVGWQISLGRYLQPVYFTLRGHFYPPLFIGVLSLLYVGIAIYLLTNLFPIENKFYICLICGILTTNAMLTLTNATYIHDSDIYMFSFLVAVCGVYLCRMLKHGILLGACFIAGSLGLYQSLFQAAVFLFMMLAVMDILHQKSFSETMKNGGKSLLCLGAGLGVYYVFLKLVLHVSGVSLSSSYNSISEVGKYDGLTDVLQNINGAYAYFFNYFLHPVTRGSTIIGVINIALMAATVALLLLIGKKRKITKENWLLLAALTVLMPFGINVIYFIAKGTEHDLMIYSFFLLYVFVIILLDELNHCCTDEAKAKNRKVYIIRQYAIPLILLTVIINSIIYANETYLKKDLEYRSTMNTMNRIIDRMEQTEGYLVGQTPVAFIGNFDTSPLSMNRSGFDTRGAGLYSNFSLTYEETYHNYFRYILGYPIQLFAGTEKEELAQYEEIQGMQPFPAKDSVKMVDGVLVVKISEISK